MHIKAAFCQGLLEQSLEPFKQLPFSVFVENRPTDEELAINPMNIYVTWEPNEYFGSASWAKDNFHKFAFILTWNKQLLETLPNAVKMLFGTSSFHEKVDEPLLAGGFDLKEEKLSFIRGDKHFTVPGHHLRWDLWSRRNDIINFRTEFYERTTPAYAANPEEEILWYRQRTNIFATSMYHVAIENTSVPNYFTEKIMDCFLFRTVPIYWGCSNISEYFNMDGIIQVNNLDELLDATDNLSREDYEKRMFALWDNQKRSLKYWKLGETIYEKILRILILKGLV